MYIVVTGAAGFIGANLVKALNERGETAHHRRRQPDAARTSSPTSSIARSPTTSTRTSSCARLADGDFDDDIAAVLHQGACSDTMETDGRYMMRNNYRYSVALLDWCQDNDVPFLYASSARGLRRGHARFAKSARARRRSTSTATRSSCSTSTCGGCCRSARRRSPASATSTSTARASSTRSGWLRSSGISAASTERRPGPPVRGLGRLRRRRAAPRFRLGRRCRQGQPRFSRPSGAQRDLQPRHRQGDDVQ